MFALLESLLPGLVDTLDIKWMESTQNLRNVSSNSVKLGKFEFGAMSLMK